MQESNWLIILAESLRAISISVLVISSFIGSRKYTREVSTMKKYIVFAISFILLFSLFEFLFQVLSGILSTFMYTPDMEEAWNSSANLSQEVVIKSNHRSFLLTLFIAFLSATIAYFIPKKFMRNDND